MKLHPEAKSLVSFDALRSPPLDAFAMDIPTDAERLRRQADDMECTAETLVSCREGARALKRQAAELRKIARHL